MYVNPSDPLIKFLSTSKIQRFINSGEFESLYQEAKLTVAASDISTLTALLLESGIDPLEDMSSIPRYFLFGSGISTFKVPKHIEIIQEQAFGKCYNLEEVILEGNLQGIHSEAFFQCSNIQRIVLGSNILHIGDRAFSAIPKGTNITYRGTVEELNNIFISKSAFPIRATIECTDGTAKRDTFSGRWEKTV